MGVEKIFSFGSWDTDHPADRHPGERIDAQFDAHANAIRALEARIDAIVRADGKLHAEVIPIFSPRQIVAPRSGFSHPGSTNVATLSDAAAENWAEVSMEWAEHMPDTIPGNILASNAITGDHWSSRWWANQAARLAARGTVAVTKLKRFVFNGSTTTFALLDDATSAPIVPATNVSQLSIVVDGVTQEPGVDFVLAAAGASVTFTTAPAADARNFATYALQGTTDVSSTTVVGATLFATRGVAAAAILPGDVIAIATGGFASAGDGGGARYYRVAGTTPGGFQSADGQWWALEKGDLNVRQFGAVGDGVGDDTAAVRLAAQAFAQTVNVLGAPYIASRMVFPPGEYKLTGSINLQSLTPNSLGNWQVSMLGAVIYFSAAGKALFDCLGSRYGHFDGGLFIGDTASIPTSVVQYGRLTALGDASGFHFTRMAVNGKWSKAAFFGLQSEIAHYDKVFIYNQDTAGGVAVILDGLNHFGITTDFSAPAQAVDTQVSTIQHTFVGCAFMVPAGGASAVENAGANQVHMYNCYGAGTGAIIRHTAVGVVGSTLIDLHYDIHCETNANNLEFVRTSSSGAFVVEGCFVNDMASQASNALIKYNTNVSLMVLQDAHLHPATYVGPLFSTPGTGVVRFGGTVRGNPASLLVLGDQDITLSTIPGLLGSRGAVNRAALGGALTTQRTWTLCPASDLPPGGTLEIDDLVGGIGAVNTLTILRAGADTINGQTSRVLNAPYSGLKLTSDGATRWTITGGTDIRLGTNTAKAAETFVSYITVKDAGGVSRKLMVCA